MDGEVRELITGYAIMQGKSDAALLGRGRIRNSTWEQRPEPVATPMGCGVGFLCVKYNKPKKIVSIESPRQTWRSEILCQLGRIGHHHQSCPLCKLEVWVCSRRSRGLMELLYPLSTWTEKLMSSLNLRLYREFRIPE